MKYQVLGDKFTLMNKRRKKMIRKTSAIMVIALLVISFVSIAISQEAQETMIVKGTIISVNVDIGKVGLQDEHGNIMTLTAGPEIDLKTLSKGDRVSVEHSSDWVIKSITKQK